MRRPSVQGTATRVASSLETAGKVLLVSAVLRIVGLGALGLAKLGVDRAPGDAFMEVRQRDGVRPIGLMVLISIIGTIVLNVFLRR